LAAGVIASFEFVLTRLRGIRIWMEGIFFAFFVAWGIGWIWVMVLDLLWGGLLILFSFIVWLIMLVVQFTAPQFFENLAPDGLGSARLNWIKAIQIGNLINWIIMLAVHFGVIGVQTGFSGAGYSVYYQGATLVGITFLFAAVYAWLRTEYEKAIEEMTGSGSLIAGALVPFLVLIVAVIFVGLGLGFGIGIWGWVIASAIWVGIGIAIYFIVAQQTGAPISPTGGIGGARMDWVKLGKWNPKWYTIWISPTAVKLVRLMKQGKLSSNRIRYQKK
jgi:hypothetical protein